jgi:hypothetical protein
MNTNPVHSTPPDQNEVTAKPTPRQSTAPPQTSIPQDKVTISPQAHAQVQAQAHHVQQSALAKTGGGKK